MNATYLGLETLQKEFDEAKQLTKLNLSHNNIVEVPKFSFVNSKMLIEADFSNNQISRVDPLAFATDSKLETLILSHNKIVSINKQLFDFLPKLKMLNLSYNAINELGASTFCRLQQLVVLDLSHNNLKILDAHAFDGGIFLPKFDQFKLLSIGGNHLSELNGFTNDRFPDVKIFGIHENHFDCCYLKNLFRSIHQHQLDLTFDENGKNPNITDSIGKKCHFDDDFVYEKETSQIDWLAIVIMVGIIVLGAIFYSIIMKFRYSETQMQIEAAENAPIKCNRQSSLDYFSDVPKY